MDLLISKLDIVASSLTNLGDDHKSMIQKL